METKFSLKDYLNYAISGILWLVIIGYYLIKMEFTTVNTILNSIKESDSELFAFTLIFFGGYLIGNILRFTDCCISNLNKFLFGDPYYYALYNDRQLKLTTKELGFIGNLCKSKRICLEQESSRIIEVKLKTIGAWRSNRKTQYLLAENYLEGKIGNGKKWRMNDLKNFYDSISAPFFVSIAILLWEACMSNLNCKTIFLIIASLMFICYKFIDRYRFLYSNYIKETYRYFIFLKIH